MPVLCLLDRINVSLSVATQAITHKSYLYSLQSKKKKNLMATCDSYDSRGEDWKLKQNISD